MRTARRLGIFLAVAGALAILSASPLSAQTCLPPACVNNVAGKVVALPVGPSIQLVQAVPSAVVDLQTAHLEFDYDPLETAQDATANGTLPCPAPHADILTCSLVTPTALDAARWTYRIAVGECRDPACETVGMLTVTIASPTLITADSMSCRVSPTTCFSAPLSHILPNLGGPGTFRLVMSREAPPRFRESAWSDPVIFTVVGAQEPPPPVPICVAGEFQEWSPWTPIVGSNPPMESQHRNRVITNQPCTGAELLTLTEVHNRPVLIAPPVKTCTYMAPLSQVLQQRNVGDVIEGNNFSAIGRGQRMDQLFIWGWKVEGYPIVGGAHLRATCLGLP